MARRKTPSRGARAAALARGAAGPAALGLGAVRRALPAPEPPTPVRIVWTEPPPPAPPPAPAPAAEEAAPRRAAPPRPRPTKIAPPPGPERPTSADPAPEGEGVAVEATEGGPGRPPDPAAGDVRAPSRVDLTLRATPPGPQLVRRPPPGTVGGPRLDLRPDGKGGYVVKQAQFTAHIGYDGSIAFSDKTALQKWQGVAYEIDVTEVVMRAVGDDPYRHAKLQVLRQTEGLRAELAKAACETRLRSSLAELQGQLTRIWQDPELAAERRRALLFELWDDCAEDGSEEVLTHAEQARATIEAFVNRHLPEGSSLGFSAAELLALNERRASRARFEPYRRAR